MENKRNRKPSGNRVRPALFTLALWLMAVAVEAQTADSVVTKAAPSPTYQPLRYEENYAYLRDSTKRTDALDGLKFMPLNRAKTAYLTIGGEARLRHQYYHNENWGLTPYRDNGNVLQRYMLHADFHLNRYVRVFGQLKSSFQNGRKGGPGPLDEDQLAIHQAFVDLTLSLTAANSLTLRTGRQESYYGNGKLVEPREGPNIRLSFDAVRLIWQWRQWRTDAFVAQPILSNPGPSDDVRNRNQTFWGVYATGPIARVIPNASADVYYFGIDNKTITYDKGTGAEHRHTLGFRLFGRAGAFDYDTENFYQWGTFATDNIRAWAVTADLGYTLGRMPRILRLSLGGAISSGDAGRSSATLRTINPLFPTGYYFGPPATFLGPSNSLALRPTLTLKPNQPITLVLSANVLWRQSLQDGLYTPAVTLLLMGQDRSARYVGSQFSLIGLWQVQRHVSLSLLAAYFATGSFVQDATPGLDVSYVSPGITYTF